jgi:hypothetical protein
MKKVSRVTLSIILGTILGMVAYVITYSINSLIHPDDPDASDTFCLIISTLFGLFIFVKFYKYLATEDFDHTGEETKKEVKIKYQKKRDYFFKKS